MKCGNRQRKDLFLNIQKSHKNYREFADLGNRQNFNTRTGGWGKCYLFCTTSPPKKSSLQKSWAFEFLNLTLKNREAVGNPLNPWAELRSARQNPAKKSVGLIAEYLLNEARTHFSKNV